MFGLCMVRQRNGKLDEFTHPAHQDCTRPFLIRVR